MLLEILWSTLHPFCLHIVLLLLQSRQTSRGKAGLPLQCHHYGELASEELYYQNSLQSYTLYMAKKTRNGHHGPTQNSLQPFQMLEESAACLTFIHTAVQRQDNCKTHGAFAIPEN